MAFGFGVSATKTNNSSTSNTSGSFNTTKTPVLPEWATNLTTGVAGRVSGLLNLNPQDLVAPAHGLQTQAGLAAGGLTGSPWNFDAAADLTRGAANTSWVDGYMNSATPQASGGRASDYVGGYLNPYLRDVVDATSADLGAHEGQVRAQQALDLAGSGAFGGSGAALTQSMTEGELARARAGTIGGLRSHAYDTALGAAAGDADRSTQASMSNPQTALQDRAQKVDFGFRGQGQQLAAGNQLAGLSTAYDSNLRDNIAAQAGLGQTFRDIDTQQRLAPVTSAEHIVAMLNGLPIGLFAGESEQGVSSENRAEKSSGSSIGVSASVGG